MTDPKFAGDKKVGESILARPEKALVDWGIPKVPRFLETYHLTLLTLLWSAFNPVFGYLAMRDSLHWLWMISLMIVLQYVTDLFDGAVGRSRGTGLIKWGFYMDHFLDYIFLCSLVLAGYIIAPETVGIYYVILLILTGGFMVNSFLSFAATNKFQISYCGIGPTETRIVFILINTIIIFTGTAHFVYSVPALCVVCFIGLIVAVVNSSHTLWRIDMNKKNETE